MRKTRPEARQAKAEVGTHDPRPMPLGRPQNPQSTNLVSQQKATPGPHGGTMAELGLSPIPDPEQCVLSMT